MGRPAMKSTPIVAAYGHMFPNLDVEREILRRADIQLVDANPLADEEFASSGAHGILLGPFKKLDGARLASLTACKGVVRYGIGVDNVDLQAASQRQIVVCNVPDYCIEEVAVHALGCGLALMRALSYWDRSVKSGAWRGGHPPVLRRPSTCTLGIVGFGQIGRILEDRARRIFGAIKVYDPWYKPAGHELGAHTSFVENLHEMLREADVVSVHVPLTPDTSDMLDETALRKMKPGAFVINASRGGIVNVPALLRVIRDGHLGGAALDTFVKEPLGKDDELLGEERILLSPHIAWKSEEAEIELRRGAAEEMVRVLTGRAPRSQIKI
jgi:D-3-phosphoglycerate dehydrogenase / 2-oxoglutarate reductase